MITLMLLSHLVLAPTPVPDPPPFPTYPGYITQGDGTRISCAPGGYTCWPSNDGLPSYLTPQG